MEAGNRCFDECLPEETNRRIGDHISDVNMCYSEHARRYLNAEGTAKERTFCLLYTSLMIHLKPDKLLVFQMKAALLPPLCCCFHCLSLFCSRKRTLLLETYQVTHRIASLL